MSVTRQGGAILYPRTAVQIQALANQFRALLCRGFAPRYSATQLLKSKLLPLIASPCLRIVELDLSPPFRTIAFHLGRTSSHSSVAHFRRYVPQFVATLLLHRSLLCPQQCLSQLYPRVALRRCPQLSFAAASPISAKHDQAQAYQSHSLRSQCRAKQRHLLCRTNQCVTNQSRRGPGLCPSLPSRPERPSRPTGVTGNTGSPGIQPPFGRSGRGFAS